MQRKEWLLAGSIPILFTVCIIIFFNFLFPESRTFSNFVSYLSSLSAIIMVVVVVFTTYLQLEEMKSTRALQTQPFPFIKPSEKSYLEAPRFFFSPPDSITQLLCRVFFYVSIENIGTGPAAAIDIIPKLRYTDESGNIVSEEPVYERIDSLKQNEKIEMDFMFSDHLRKKKLMHECILTSYLSLDNRKLATLDLTMFYKNVLGASFKERISIEMWFYEEDMEKLKSCLKLLEAAKIDYGEDMRKVDSLAKSNPEKSHELLAIINKELSKKEGCTDIPFLAEPVLGSFSVEPISEKEYQKELRQRSYPRFCGTPSRAELQRQ